LYIFKSKSSYNQITYNEEKVNLVWHDLGNKAEYMQHDGCLK